MPESSPSVIELESRMRPGALSQDGFLGKDERLEEVLARDSQSVHDLGVSYEELADFLEDLIQKAIDSEDGCAKVWPFLIKIKLYTGFQICPWSKDIHHAQCAEAGGVRYGSVDWCIKNLNIQREMCGPGLITHLIRAHHFFEGFRSPHRVDPRQLVQLLELGR